MCLSDDHRLRACTPQIRHPSRSRKAGLGAQACERVRASIRCTWTNPSVTIEILPLPPDPPFQPEQRPPTWSPTVAPPGVPDTTPAPGPKTAASMYKQWAVNSFLDQASERTNWHISTLIPPPTRGEFLGGWAATWGASEVVWSGLDKSGERRELSVQGAVNRLIELHSQIFQEKRPTLLTLHVHVRGDDPSSLFVNEDLAYRERSLAKFRTAYPDHWPITSGVEEHLPIQPLDAACLSKVLETAHEPRRVQHFATAVEASHRVIRDLGLRPFGQERRARKLVRFGPADVPPFLTRLSSLLADDGATLVVTVASVSQTCERWWVFEEKIKALAQAARAVLEEPKIDGFEDADAAFSTFRFAWQSVRQEVKATLEEFIESLSTQPFETFEDKAKIAAQLNEQLDAWSFKAISPSTGRAAYFQCRVAARSPKGHFFFQDVDPESAPVGPVDPDGPRAPSRIPAFKLTDAPPNPRRRQAE